MLPTSPDCSEYLLLRLRPSHVAMFRFLLEAYENLAMFTVLDRREALLKVFFAPGSKELVHAALGEISQSLPISISPWPGGCSRSSG